MFLFGLGVKVKLQIWDTAGQERFRSITQSYYRSAHCLMLVYDISSQPSFDSLSQWCRDIEQYAGCKYSTIYSLKCARALCSLQSDINLKASILSFHLKIFDTMSCECFAAKFANHSKMIKDILLNAGPYQPLFMYYK